MLAILFAILSQTAKYPTPQARVELVPSTIGIREEQKLGSATYFPRSTLLSSRPSYCWMDRIVVTDSKEFPLET